MNRSHWTPVYPALLAALVFGLPTSAYSHADPDMDGLIDGGGNIAKDWQAKLQTGTATLY